MTSKKHNNEFKDLHGLPPDTIPHNPKDVPKKLEPVKQRKLPNIVFNMGNYLRILWMYFLADVEKKLSPAEYVKASKTWTCIGIIFFLLVVIGVISIWK